MIHFYCCGFVCDNVTLSAFPMNAADGSKMLTVTHHMDAYNYTNTIKIIASGAVKLIHNKNI